MPFHSTGPHWCPHCPAVVNRRGERCDVALELVVSDYSGCGVDIADCPRCGRTFQVSYRVDAVTELDEHWMPKEDADP